LARHVRAAAPQDRDVSLLDVISVALVPSLCAACGRSCRPQAVICPRCTRRLAAAQPIAGTGPPGVDRSWSSAPHDGVARDLVAALKFRRLLPVADLIAGRIHWLVPRTLLSGELVPVPAARLRSIARGFDPTGEIAEALADRAGMQLNDCLTRGGGRQLGRRRAQRISRPPAVHVRGRAPSSAVLLDDVLTTGATLSACARALRSAGASQVVAVTFSRRL
jgi:predicted amidophosphoribosyltransferase